MDEIDNEHNDPENANIDAEIQEKITNAGTTDELNVIYKQYQNITSDKNRFIELLTAKKKELSND